MKKYKQIDRQLARTFRNELVGQMDDQLAAAVWYPVDNELRGQLGGGSRSKWELSLCPWSSTLSDTLGYKIMKKRRGIDYEKI